MSRSKLFLTLLLAAGFEVLSSTAAHGQVDRFKYTTDVPIEWYLTPAEFPCLTETIYLVGTYKERSNFLVNPASGVHWTLHQTTGNLTAVGLTTQDTYRFSGPLTQTLNGSTDGVEPVEFTLHNINHFVGPGEDANIYFRSLTHLTWNPATGEVKVEVSRDDVLCK